ncbi:hypothetical protein [Bacillus canaveralius]|nr:hypothetical protein [Bacillus canaveralius]
MYLSRTREIAKMYLEQSGEVNIPEMGIVCKDENKRAAIYETLYNWTVSFRKILEKKTGVHLDMNPHSFRHSLLENYENGNALQF